MNASQDHTVRHPFFSSYPILILALVWELPGACLALVTWFPASAGPWQGDRSLGRGTCALTSKCHLGGILHEAVVTTAESALSWSHPGVFASRNYNIYGILDLKGLERQEEWG